MSQAERYMEMVESRGFRDVDGFVCMAHVDNAALRDNLREHIVDGECRLCGQINSPQPSVVPLQELMAEVMGAVHFLYESPEDAGVPWDDGWQGATVHETWEVIDEICSGAFDGDVSDELLEILAGSVVEDEWTENRHAESLEAARWAWEQFVSDVTSESRFVFVPHHAVAGPETPGLRSAGFLLSLLPYVENGELGLLTKVPIGSAFFRGRLVESRFSRMKTAKELGPAPAVHAAANRMSPEGIPMFYGSATPETAVREIAAHGTHMYAQIGTFRNQRELTVLDLTSLPDVPSIFDRKEWGGHGVIRFFRDFAQNVAAPVNPDGRPHVQYVPTQVVTEFFRWVPEIKVDGIKLRSAQDHGDTYVLFFIEEQVADEDSLK